MRRRLTWLVALPAILAGSQAAHALAYRLVFPEASLRLHVLALTGHGYLAQLPLALGAAGAVGLVGLATAVLDAAHGRRVRDLPPVAFAFLPPLAFAVQEVLELSLHTGTVGWRAVAAPTFLPGLALQLPFAALAYVAARLLLRTAVRLGQALVPPPSVRSSVVFFEGRDLAEARFHVSRRSSRGPPRAVGI